MEIVDNHAYKFKFYVGEEVIDARFCSGEFNVKSQGLNNGTQSLQLVDGEPTFKVKNADGEWEEVNFDRWELVYDSEIDDRPRFSHYYYPSGTSSHGSGVKNGF